MTRFVFFAAAALVALFSAPAMADPFSLEGRLVPVRVEGQQALSSAGLAVEAAESRELRLLFPIDLSVDLEYAIIVANSTAPEIIVNGRRLDVDPMEFPKAAGVIVRVPRMYLRNGDNEIEIARGEGEAAGSWDGTVMFSLDGSYEEVHFGRAFGDRTLMAAPAQDPNQENYDVQWYDLYIQPSMASATITSAVLTMGAKVVNTSISQCVLDFEPNGSAPALLLVASVDSGPGTPPLAYTVNNVTDRITITLPQTFGVGDEFTVRVAYSGTPRTGGTFGSAYVRSTHSGTAVVYTFSEPYNARRWWPCKDLPYDKATTASFHVRIPSGAGWKAVTCGKLDNIQNNGDGTETWHWTHDFPISTYLVSLGISNYTEVSSVYTALDTVTTMGITHFIYPENFGTESTGAAGTLEVMNFFTSVFGEYPFLTEKYSTYSHGSGSGMEHQTCTGMPGGDVFDGMQRRNVHELAHHWFGNLITCETFDHLWLNEGFATYCEALWDEFKFGKAAFHARVNGWSVTTSTPVVGPNSDAFAGSVVYRKGAWVLHMLRKVVGDEDFFATLKDWADLPSVRYGTADSDDFKAVAEARSGKQLDVFFDQWLYRPGVGEPSAQPTYAYSGSRPSAGNVVNVQLTQTQSGTPFEMPIEIEFTDASSSTTRVMVENTTGNQTIPVDLGSFNPVLMTFDPENWLLESRTLSIRTCGLPVAIRNQVFSTSLTAASGSTPYSWSQTGLPTGLSLSSGGVISGTPTAAAGSYAVNFTVTDNALRTRSVSLLMTIQAPASVDDWSQY